MGIEFFVKLDRLAPVIRMMYNRQEGGSGMLVPWIRQGRRIPHRWESRVHWVGMVLLLWLALLVSLFDLLRLLP